MYKISWFCFCFKFISPSFRRKRLPMFLSHVMQQLKTLQCSKGSFLVMAHFSGWGNDDSIVIYMYFGNIWQSIYLELILSLAVVLCHQSCGTQKNVFKQPIANTVYILLLSMFISFIFMEIINQALMFFFKSKHLGMASIKTPNSF